MQLNKFSSSIVTMKTKSKIKGAISPIQDFVFYNIIRYNDFNHYEDSKDTINSFLPVDSSIVADLKNKIFVSSDGVVCDAYDLSEYNDEEISHITKTILATKKYTYPGYDFVIKEGVFPINVRGSFSKNDEIEEGISPNMSTHILYLTNYKDFLPKEKKLIK